MKVYKNRHNRTYIKKLRERLSIGGANGLRSRSIKIAEPRIHGGVVFDRCCRIDFAGIAATSLFDVSGNICDYSVADCTKDIFVSASELNQQGIFVKFRILLVYPYSAYALARIQAEQTQNRASMDTPVYGRNLNVVEFVDERTFLQSHTVVAQTRMLEQLQEWVDECGWDNKSLNRIMVRFVPASPNFCLLFINDTVFLDPYLLAKEKREKKRLALLGPLVEVENSKDPLTFKAIDDHFRYLWDLDMSMFCQDATRYERGSAGSLGAIKPPAEVSFDSKASKIREKKTDLSEDDIAKWKSRARRVLNRFCMKPAPAPGSESLFITCAWKTTAGQATPNDYAKELSDYLERDFGHSRKIPLLSVFIMEGVAGEFFSQQLYSRMNQSTLGLVLLTRDIEGIDGRTYSKPNVYHELGYLMRQLGEKRVAIVSEGGVTVPTNIHDIIRIDFGRDKLILMYAKIAGWVIRSAGFSSNVRTEVEQNITVRLNEAAGDGSITSEEARRARERVGNYLL